jgi:conjugative transposon TraM protein
MKAHTQKFIQKRKFYMALPVLVIPFMTMFFWALGGGKGVAVAMTEETVGLNLKLPGAKFDDEGNAWDKLALYQKARRDSVKANQAKRSDPYFRLTTLKITQDTSKRDSLKTQGGMNASLGDRVEPLDETEAKVYKKLAELQKEIDKPAAKSSTSRQKKNQTAQSSNADFQTDVDRLESMMVMMQNDPEQDKEMEEINGVLNKIIDIQHPGRVKERIEGEQKKNDNSLTTRPEKREDQIGLIRNTASIQTLPGMAPQNGFFGLEESVTPALEANAIRAEIYGNQNLVAGSVIKMELLQDINVSGVRIPKNHFVYGECSLNGERLTVKVASIQYDNSVYPVSLEVYDVDGLEGIHVPGAIARDAAKKSSNQAIQDIQLSSLDPSIEVQAASAGIEAAKGMLSKKTRLIQVTVKAGYKVFLKDKNNLNSQSN